jgi:hypothetical protein
VFNLITLEKAKRKSLRATAIRFNNSGNLNLLYDDDTHDRCNRKINLNFFVSELIQNI